MVAPTTSVLLRAILVLIFLAFIAAVLSRCKSRLYGALQTTPYTTLQLDESMGGYSFIADGFQDYDILKPLIDDLMVNYGIRDFQFYDWFANYSGNATFEPPPEKVTPPYLLNWWNCASWKDGYRVKRDISRTVVFQAIQQIHAKGGRAWAYIQAQGSEDPNLVTKFKNHTPHSDVLEQIGTIPHGFTNDAALVTIYAQTEALADYQADNWIQPVVDLGFFGIHWDLNVGEERESDTKAFLERTGSRLKTNKSNPLFQTFNDIDLNQKISSNPANFDSTKPENGLLYFPYSEIWSDPKSSEYIQAVAKGPLANAVVMAHPASCLYGVPPPTDNCSANSFCKTQTVITCCSDIYNPSQNCTTPWQLAAERLKIYQNTTPPMRYCINGIGSQDKTNNIIVGMMRTEYFPIVYPNPIKL